MKTWDVPYYVVVECECKHSFSVRKDTSVYSYVKCICDRKYNVGEIFKDAGLHVNVPQKAGDKELPAGDRV